MSAIAVFHLCDSQRQLVFHPYIPGARPCPPPPSPPSLDLTLVPYATPSIHIVPVAEEAPSDPEWSQDIIQNKVKPFPVRMHMRV